jgi:2-keto-4-pentenoate hydratase/2-oxohepta-3-ene-1,7-dioic acid hydratase in catechol pathway
MKIVRYKIYNSKKFGLLRGNTVIEINGDIFESFKLTSIAHDLNNVTILPPISPSKIIALGYNYKDLVGERTSYDEPIIFIKPNSSIIGPNEKIIIPERRKTWLEIELGIVIKKTCRNVSVQDAHNYILGYTIANDITMENILNRDHHLIRSKGWDTFCPIGPHIETDIDTSNLKLTSRINGKIMQCSNVNKRILNDFETVSFISEKISLYPGDLIITGTPANAESSIINDGDLLELSIENIGTLTNRVISKEY